MINMQFLSINNFFEFITSHFNPVQIAMIIVVSFLLILLVMTVYCTIMSYSYLSFYDKTYRMIIKDCLTLIIVPILVNIFSNKLSAQDLENSSIVLILLILYYILLDIFELNDSDSFLSISYLVESIIISSSLFIICLILVLVLLKALNIITFHNIW